MNPHPVNELHTDLRAEVVAAELLERAGGLQGILLERRPSLERPYSKDVLDVRFATSSVDGAAHWRIHSCREGLYEALPENVFHEATLGSVYASEEEVIHRIRRQRAEEAEARAFFAPFEQELSYLNVSMYALEKAVCRTHSEEIVGVFARLWPFLERIDPLSARVFIYILPFLHRVKGDFRWTEDYLSLFTGLPVRISEYPRTLEPSGDAGLYSLGSQALGEGMLLYGPARDGETDLLITIGPVPWHRMDDYAPGAPFGKILAELYQHFIPFHKSWRQELVSPAGGRNFVLGQPEHAGLGYSAYLS